VDDTLVPDGTPVDERKLVFFSSPNKGLDFALDAFAALKDHMPDLRLVVGDQGDFARLRPSICNVHATSYCEVSRHATVGTITSATFAVGTGSDSASYTNHRDIACPHSDRSSPDRSCSELSRQVVRRRPGAFQPHG